MRVRGPSRPPQVRLAVDLPEPEILSAGSFVIHGWAFSRGRRIVGVQARLGARASKRLSYGIRRPDVAVAFSAPEAATCGFEGTLGFEPVDTNQTERLIVRAVDELGEMPRRTSAYDSSRRARRARRSRFRRWPPTTIGRMQPHQLARRWSDKSKMPWTS